MKNALISLRDVAVELSGKRILNNINFDIYPNEIISIIGLNGAGKTTLLKIILGILTPSAGEIIKNTKKIGYVPQKLEFDSTIPFSVKELLKIYSNKSEIKIAEKLREVNADHLLDKKIGNLSGGELQRVLIANALLQKPDLLLLDEATAGIDITGEKIFYDLIDDIHKKYGISIVIVSHDIHTVFSKTTRVFCLHHKICCDDTPEVVSRNPEFKKIFGTHIVPYRHQHDHKSD